MTRKVLAILTMQQTRGAMQETATECEVMQVTPGMTRLDVPLRLKEKMPSAAGGVILHFSVERYDLDDLDMNNPVPGRESAIRDNYQEAQ